MGFLVYLSLTVFFLSLIHRFFSKEQMISFNENIKKETVDGKLTTKGKELMKKYSSPYIIYIVLITLLMFCMLFTKEFTWITIAWILFVKSIENIKNKTLLLIASLFTYACMLSPVIAWYFLNYM